MTTPNTHAFYSALGIQLPDGTASNATVRCFAQPDAHQHGDRTPSCSISRVTGAWNCHGCGAHGGAYDAALTTGRAPRAAMQLLIEHGLAEPRATDHRPPNHPATRTRAATPQRQPLKVPSLAAGEDDITVWTERLQDNSRLMRRLAVERAWANSVISELQIGFDGTRITIPIRNTSGELQGVLRYAPFGPRDPKMLALPGSRLGLIPNPARITQSSLVLVEGPPDMIAARSCGLAAIAIPGTSAWQRSWADLLAGKHVTLVMDCDQPGRTAGAKIAADLRTDRVHVDPVDLSPNRHDGYDLTDRILERRRQCTSPLAAASVEALLRPTPTLDRTRTTARASGRRGWLTRALASTADHQEWLP